MADEPIQEPQAPEAAPPEKPGKKPKKVKPDKPKGKKKSKLPMLLVLVLVLGGGGFFAKTKMAHKKEPPKAPKVGSTIELDEFLVNLAHGSSFLKCKVALGLVEGKDAKSLEEKMPALKDGIVMMLSSKSEAELRDTEGKVALKTAIKDTLNGILREKSEGAEANNAHREPNKNGATSGDAQAPKQTDGPVLEVYFTAFAMS